MLDFMLLENLYTFKLDRGVPSTRSAYPYHNHFSLPNVGVGPEVFEVETHWTFCHTIQFFIVPVPTVLATIPPPHAGSMPSVKVILARDHLPSKKCIMHKHRVPQ